MLTQEQALNALRSVADPAFGNRDIVSLGFVQELKAADGRIAFDLQTARTSEAALVLKAQAEQALKNAGAQAVEVTLTTRARANPAAQGKGVIEGVRNIIPVASGKGGVGKSTVSVNLAMALKLAGARVALLDADVYGPSAPTILGVETPPEQIGARLKPALSHGLPMISTGFFLRPDQAVIWRGPMLSKMVDELFHRVDWGELDYLIVDLPPGTGDVQLTLCQRINLTGAVIVTTPQPVAVNIAEKAIIMFQQLETPILGVIENMSYFESSKTGEREYIFGSGGADILAKRWRTPVLGKVPLATTLRETSDSGRPIVLAEPDAPAAKALVSAAEQFVAAVAQRNFAAEQETKVEINF
jgi:ATP-binding protein involved in chromosome partitioning